MNVTIKSNASNATLNRAIIRHLKVPATHTRMVYRMAGAGHVMDEHLFEIDYTKDANAVIALLDREHRWHSLTNGPSAPSHWVCIEAWEGRRMTKGSRLRSHNWADSSFTRAACFALLGAHGVKIIPSHSP